MPKLYGDLRRSHFVFCLCSCCLLSTLYHPSFGPHSTTYYHLAGSWLPYDDDDDHRAKGEKRQLSIVAKMPGDPRDPMYAPITGGRKSRRKGLVAGTLPKSQVPPFCMPRSIRWKHRSFYRAHHLRSITHTDTTMIKHTYIATFISQ